MADLWADLPGDLLNLVLSKLLFGKDKHSFSLVCKPWNAVAATSPYRCSPCLVYYHSLTHTWKFYQYNNPFTMSFPELENAELRCSKYGWLLMSLKNGNVFFFDPSNNQKIDLPGKLPHDYSNLCFFNPPTSPECMVVATLTFIEGIRIATQKRGEGKWKTKNYHTTYPDYFWVSYGAPVLHCGLIYMLSLKGDVAIFDIEQQRLDFHFKCLSPEIKSFMFINEEYMVKVNGEDAVFGVFVFALKNVRKVQIFRLSSDMKWDLVEGIGDKVLYLTQISSLVGKAGNKVMENSIYFPWFHGRDAVFYSLRDAKYHSIDGDYSGNASGLNKEDPAAWIMPMPIPTQEPFTTSLSWL